MVYIFRTGLKLSIPEVVFMKNFCIPNTYFNVGLDGTIFMKASVDIKKGEMVTRSLADVMKCSQFRRKDLEKEYFADCECERCSDRTEFGTAKKIF